MPRGSRATPMLPLGAMATGNSAFAEGVRSPTATSAVGTPLAAASPIGGSSPPVLLGRLHHGIAGTANPFGYADMGVAQQHASTYAGQQALHPVLLGRLGRGTGTPQYGLR
eukprot:TRINITY_DN14670_c0_g1_i8.p1 TRINITY_DN14670_c0_g1~~TRINITY_DN14670_c0_g1_i8.p1  ORF type:complete len:111 (-),score=2.16 TRINITY_DN14670_c0_g1_i8:165-497(-)